jgi:hypothetical protein
VSKYVIAGEGIGIERSKYLEQEYHREVVAGERTGTASEKWWLEKEQETAREKW